MKSVRKKLIHGMTTVGERGQIVIPQGVRESLALRAGDTLFVIARDGKIVIFPADEMQSLYKEMLDGIERLNKKLKSSK